MQAVLILAHKNLKQVVELSKKLTPYFNVYLHIDKKASINPSLLNELDSMHVNYFSKYNVKWGSYNIVLSTVFLMKKALKNKQNTYFHLISGQDWPMKDPRKIFNDFNDDNKIYMNYFKADDKVKAGERLIWWVKYYFNYNQVNRRSLFGKIYHRIILNTQRVIGIDKFKRYHMESSNIYAGEEWVDIPRDALTYAIKIFDSDTNLKKIFETSFCSDEMWLQTILCNSSFKERIDKNIHRYINWTEKNGSYPAILDVNDYQAIKRGQYWWGRKISMPISKGLIDKLDRC
ncbi:beta-1,6-N-acetylglucosaminyltransferase [uncultured Limosilactobacillus sp.]|uniref:beta-1,6-N-acetylglucosaminyltransferase n=1 Tax=uncultured Limosilactobacillus sp. TaxID=2837629 RepID=UPI0025D9D00E|nr:beta-1,6-N-acetylglucosaminyltransferase [uncultured Limosilactobacillus sp.]